MIKNIFFDFNGTILDDTKLCFEIEEEMLIKEGLPKVSLSFYLDHFCFPVIEYYKMVGFDCSKENYAILSQYFFTNYTNRQSKETCLSGDIKEILEELKNDDYRLYILSASEEKILKIQLEQLGILSYFDGIIASNNIAALGKIDYGKKYIEEHSIDPKVSVMIGDTYHDYEVAEALNLKPILYSKGHNSRKVLEKSNATIVDSFSEFYSLLKNNQI